MNARLGLLGRVARKLRHLSAPRPVNTLAEAIKDARRIAFVGRTRADAKTAGWIADAERRGATVDILPTMLPYRREDGVVMSFLDDAPRTPYDCIVLHHRIALFEHSWSYALLDRLNSMLAERGTVLVSAGPEQIPRAGLERLFAARPVHADARHLAFAKAQGGLVRPPEAAISTLDAYWALSDTLLRDKFDPRLANVVRALGIPRASPPPHDDADPLARLQSQSYRACSARTKSALVEYIVSLHFPGRRDLHLVDLGAGSGFNSLELLLNPGGVGTVTMVELNYNYHWAIAALYDWLGERVRGKVALAGGPAQDYRGRPADAALISGVLSIVGEENREPLLESAWENLRPGGILIVFENMQKDDPDHAIRFNETRCTPQMLDAMLTSRAAPIRYFHAQALKEMDFEEVGNETVFRAIRKPV
ncbi:MAG: class I SAM-dependent methyltransferase [Alphaproteobacteria bacterium]|nr:class I SAM-dependent methyltransferase [Alphaproteobacteria bacterium]